MFVIQGFIRPNLALKNAVGILWVFSQKETAKKYTPIRRNQTVISTDAPLSFCKYTTYRKS